MNNTTAIIRNKLRVKGRTPNPHTGWMTTSRREHIAEMFAECGFKVGAEIGVRWGEYSEMILRKNPGVKLYCVDSWAPYERVGQVRQDRIYSRAKRVLGHLGATLIRKPSQEALADFADRSLDFVYIDAMHDFDNCMMDLIGWSKKVKSGGIVAGHDFTNMPGCGVIPAVEAYTRGHMIYEWYITRDELHSFLWVNP